MNVTCKQCTKNNTFFHGRQTFHRESENGTHILPSIFELLSTLLVDKHTGIDISTSSSLSSPTPLCVVSLPPCLCYRRPTQDQSVFLFFFLISLFLFLSVNGSYRKCKVKLSRWLVLASSSHCNDNTLFLDEALLWLSSQKKNQLQRKKNSMYVSCVIPARLGSRLAVNYCPSLAFPYCVYFCRTTVWAEKLVGRTLVINGW